MEKNIVPTAHEIEFIQTLFDRYSENGGIVDLSLDGKTLLSIVRQFYDPKNSKKFESIGEENTIDLIARAAESAADEIIRTSYPTDVNWATANSLKVFADSLYKIQKS